MHNLNIINLENIMSLIMNYYISNQTTNNYTPIKQPFLQEKCTYVFNFRRHTNYAQASTTEAYASLRLFTHPIANRKHSKTWILKSKNGLKKEGISETCML